MIIHFLLTLSTVQVKHNGIWTFIVQLISRIFYTIQHNFKKKKWNSLYKFSHTQHTKSSLYQLPLILEEQNLRYPQTLSGGNCTSTWIRTGVYSSMNVSQSDLTLTGRRLHTLLKAFSICSCKKKKIKKKALSPPVKLSSKFHPYMPLCDTNLYVIFVTYLVWHITVPQNGSFLGISEHQLSITHHHHLVPSPQVIRLAAIDL